MKKAILAVTAISALCASALLPANAQAADSPLFPAISLIAGFLNQGIFPESDLYTTDDDIIINATDGVELAANVFVPTTGSGPYPAVIFINSWAANEYQYLTEAARFAEEGYVVLSYSTRGFGTSGGLIDTAGPLDMADLSAVIDYLITHFDVDPNAIGAAGISYGSGISLLGAAHDPRISAVAAMSTWGSLTEALYGQETPRLIWGELLTLSSGLTGNPDQIIRDTWNKVLNREDMASVYAWTDLRSPLNYVDEINANGAAVYISQNWGDNLFQPNSVLDLFSRLSVEKHIDLQPGTHAGAEIGGLLGGGDTHVLNNVHRWFAEHLKGESGAMEGQKPVHMKVKFSSGYQEYDAFPVPQATTETFYLQPRNLFRNGQLSDTPFQSWLAKDNSINSLFDTVASTQVPLLSQILEQLEVPVLANIGHIQRSNGIVFESNRRWSDMQIRGNAELSLMVQPKSDNLHMVAYLYDMNPLGVGKMITHKPLTVHDTTPGETLRVDFPLTTVAYDVPAGHKLVLVIDTHDLLYAGPQGVRSIDFEFSSGEQSTLTVPVL
ncbi:MAG: acyl esterase [Oceanospirillaceae bacterium]|nr:acyl esterase [Oceanospirillaceae bacterium]|tara:strand:- start:50424 stop:52082 length:1659 start_codon:yes stop_codon:yes gene_type:complete